MTRPAMLARFVCRDADGAAVPMPQTPPGLTGWGVFGYLCRMKIRACYVPGIEVEGTLAEDCPAWDAVGMALVTAPAGTVARFPNGPVPCKRDAQFAEFSPGQVFGPG